MAHVLVDSLGDLYPTFPQFVSMLRQYEADLNKRADVPPTMLQGWPDGSETAKAYAQQFAAAQADYEAAYRDAFNVWLVEYRR